MSRILVIDDEVSLRGVLRRVLEQAGHTVFEASDGREGMALWRREQTDVVVTDLYMPEKDDIEVIREVRRSTMKSKLICMSGGGQREVFDWGETALSLGADAVLEKPFDQGMLLSVIQEVLAGIAKSEDAVLPLEPGRAA